MFSLVRPVFILASLLVPVHGECDSSTGTCPTTKVEEVNSLLQAKVKVAEAESQVAIQNKMLSRSDLMRGDDPVQVQMDEDAAGPEDGEGEGTSLPLPKFVYISSGKCADIGMRPIQDSDECSTGFRIASCLGGKCRTLKGNQETKPKKPPGCYYEEFMKDGEVKNKLRFNKDAGSEPSDTSRVICTRDVAKAKVPTCAEELLVRHKAYRMLNTKKWEGKLVGKSRFLWTDIGASESFQSVVSGRWKKLSHPIVLGPALVRMVFHDFVDRNNLGGTTSAGGFDACLHAPAKSDSKKGFDEDMKELHTDHNSGLEEAFTMVRILVKDTSLSIPDGVLVATVAFLEGLAGLEKKTDLKFGRPDVTCDGGNKFGRTGSGQIYLAASPTKFDEPQTNIDFFKGVLKFDAREMVALYGAHTLGGLNNGVIPYGSLGGVREAPFCADPSKGGRAISQALKDKTKYGDKRSITRDSSFFDVWFDKTPGTFDVHYFKQMITEWDAHPEPYDIGDGWTASGKMNKTYTGARAIAWDLNTNPQVGNAHYAAPAFPKCGQAGGTLLGEAKRQCKKEGITDQVMDTETFSCPHWETACDAGSWCRHIPDINHPNQANIKSLMQWTSYGGRKGRVVTLPSDWALLMDDETRKHVRDFNDHPETFHQAFADVMAKMVNQGHTDLQHCKAVDCSIDQDAQTFSCSGVELKNCDSTPQGNNCKLAGSFGHKGEVACEEEKKFLCEIHESDDWNALFT